MTDPSCPKCRAGRANLFRADRYLEGGEHLQEIVCRLCGAILASRLVEVERYPLAPEAPGLRQRADVRPSAESVRKMKRSRAAALENRRIPCGLKGCDGTYLDLNNKHGLCPSHSKRLSGWWYAYRTGAVRNQPPIARVNGVWIERGAPLPGIPGERPAGAVKAPKRHGGGRSRKPLWVGTCEGCGTPSVEIVAWGLCPECHAGYLAGTVRI